MIMQFNYFPYVKNIFALMIFCNLFNQAMQCRNINTESVLQDRYMSPDIQAVTKMLKEGKIWGAVRGHIEAYHSNQTIETRVFSPSTFTAGEDRPRPQSAQPRKRKVSLTSANGSKYSKAE